MIHAILLAQALKRPASYYGRGFMPIQVCRDEVAPYGSGYPLKNRTEMKDNLNVVIAVQRVTRIGGHKIVAYIVQLANRNEYIQTEPSIFVPQNDRARLLRVAAASKLLMHTTVQNFRIAVNSTSAAFNRIYSLWSIRAFLAQGLTIKACTPHSIGVPPPA